MNQIKKYFLPVFFTFICSYSYSQQLPLGTEFEGKASYYGREFYGRKTASGQILKIEELTCAHPTLPFGTMLEVTNLQNNKWVVVRVNDRGPYSKNRIIDLTHASAETLGMFLEGVINVKIMVVGDAGTVYISRATAIVENSEELLKAELDLLAVPLDPEEDGKIKQKQKRIVEKKRANRRKGK